MHAFVHFFLVIEIFCSAVKKGFERERERGRNENKDEWHVNAWVWVGEYGYVWVCVSNFPRCDRRTNRCGETDEWGTAARFFFSLLSFPDYFLFICPKLLFSFASLYILFFSILRDCFSFLCDPNGSWISFLSRVPFRIFFVVHEKSEGNVWSIIFTPSRNYSGSFIQENVCAFVFFYLFSASFFIFALIHPKFPFSIILLLFLWLLLTFL